MSKARELSKLLSGTLKVGALQAPAGTTAQRPSGQVGQIRYNSETGKNETYDSGGWSAIATPPLITTVSPSTYNGEAGTQFTINGSLFDIGANVKFIDNAGVEYTAATVTRVNGGQLLATTSQDFTVAQEPLKVKVLNPSGLAYILEAAIDCGGVPTWTTSAGTLATVNYNASATLSAQLQAGDPDVGATIQYLLASGSLPSGASLNTSSGLISGTVSNPGNNTVTSNFTINAQDNAGNTTQRAFSIIVRDQNRDSNTIFYAPLTANATEIVNSANPINNGGSISSAGGYTGLYLNNDAYTEWDSSSGISSLSGVGNWTVEYWLYKTGGTSDGSLQTECEIGAGANYYQTGLLARLTSFYFKGTSAGTFANNRSLNQWHHVAWVGDGGTLREYQNGSQVNSWARGDSAFSSGISGARFGRSQHTSGQYINGYFRKIRISNTTRYSGGSSFTPSSTHPI